MKCFPNLAGPICLAAAVLVISSCGPSHGLRDEHIEQDVRFGFDKLRGSSLLVAGVASEQPLFAAEERVRTGGMLSNMLIEKLGGAHGIRIVGSGQLVGSMGLDAYGGLMTRVDREGGLMHEDLPVLRDAVGEFDYILLAYITNENVIDFEDERTVPTKDGSERETEYEKRFYLTIDFQIYEVKHEKMVWSNVIYNEAVNTETRSTPSGCVESCFSSLLQTILFGTPAEISREEVLDEMVERFAENLQRAKAK